MFVNLTISFINAKESIASLEETNFIFRKLLANYPKNATEVIIKGPPIKDEDLEYIVTALIRTKLDLNIRVENIKKKKDGKIKFNVLTIDDKIALIKASRKKLKNSNFSVIY